MFDRRCDCEYEHKLRTTEKRILYAIIAAIVAVLALAVYVNTAHAGPIDETRSCPTLTDIERETTQRETWQSRALMAENNLELACALLLTAYRETDDLAGAWYVAVAKEIEACGLFISEGDNPQCRGMDPNGFRYADRCEIGGMTP